MDENRQNGKNRPLAALRSAQSILAVAAFAPVFLYGQNLPATAAQGDELYAKQCAGCHGADARGTDRGPGLASNRRVRSRNADQLRAFIRKGAPSSGMPGFDLPENELDALAALLRSLNAPAAQAVATGDAAAGKAFFEGRGQCTSCHMVTGAGRAIGPDLSNAGNEMTVEELREALTQPSARLAPGFARATVRLRNGEIVRGFVKSRTGVDIGLIDFEGKFHSIQNSETTAIEDETESLMGPLNAAEDETRDLIAYLARLTGVKPDTPASAGPPGPHDITFSRIVDPDPGDWLTYNGKLSGNRYSELTEINTSNVQKLGLKWTFTVPLWAQLLPNTPYFVENMKYFGLETTPLVADGVMYITGPHQAIALDALTGRVIWRYSRPRTEGLVGDASLGTNRGAAILGDKIFLTTDSAHLIALNRATGALVWEAIMPEEPQRYGSTVAPLVVKDMVVAGVSGGDWGIRGFLAAYKASTGERAWRFWTIPDKGEPGYDTWKGKHPEFGGGSTWLTGSYDTETDTLFWPTATPWPGTDDRDRPGDNLYTECILALDPNTGKLKWHYQFTPHDTHVWDATEPSVLVNTTYRGKERKLMLHADRNGFFYVFDRTNGELLLAKNFVEVTWASGIGADGRPQLKPETEVSCPEDATNWNATAFSPTTRLYYLMVLEKCVPRVSPGNWKAKRAEVKPGRKYLRALDIETGKAVWEIPQTGPIEGKRWAGVLATAGGILIYADPNGDLIAVDQKDGKTLWRIGTNQTIKSAPITYTANGHQYIAIAAGSNILCFGLP
ncbi:MAG: PQQ-binding-like beta-propeller repeat protein [Bryobacterales bacterium]|nr:PQQ-binding-like beta-propeller repeat protein [Bryobacterales bacterium]